MPSETSSSGSGCVYLVPTPIGNLEDITLRAIRVLREVACVFAEDTRTTRKLYSHLDIPVPKLVSLHDGNEAARVDQVMALLSQGQSVAVVSEAGSPCISDPGYRLVSELLESGAQVVSLPGPVAAITALAGSGLPSDAFLFVGFPPRKPGARQKLFANLSRIPATLIFYESPERVGATLRDLCQALSPDRRAVVARELTKLHEEYARGTLAELAERYGSEGPRGECTIVCEGASDEQAAEAGIDVEAAMRKLLAEGASAKDAAARLVVKTGRGRRELYQLALALAREKAD